MRLFDGKKVADKILEDLKKKIGAENLKPKLAVFLIGEDEASKIYIRLKKEAAELIGVEFELFQYDVPYFCHPEPQAKDLIGRKNHRDEILHCVQDDILGKINELNEDRSVNGIIVQLPLSKGLDKDKILSMVDPRKDVDGFHKENQRLFEQGRRRFEPVLPTAILMAIEDALGTSLCHSERSVAKRRISAPTMRSFAGACNAMPARQPNGSHGGGRSIAGRGVQDDRIQNKKTIALVNSDIFGKTLKLVLGKKGMDFEYKLTKDFLVSGAKSDLKEADIIITACGRPGLVRGEMIKQGTVLIDAGIYRAKDGKVVGDIDRPSVESIAGFLTPVPGGIGPLVIALLLQNIYLAARIALRNYG
jgi:methylenetetrahydrofolate dehydrogenase (NADP+)/methenyltetrahydrofolate cyclohydrolase